MNKLAHFIALTLAVSAIAGCMDEEKKKQHPFATEAVQRKTDDAQKF